MAKRFTDTNKYKKPFVRSLPGAYKLLWDFLYHDCDHAGIWIVDFDIAQVYLGPDMPVSRREALELFNQDEVRIVELDGGAKWFIPSFIEFQYGQLSEKNRAHFSVITMLKKYNLLTDDLQISFSNKPLTSPLQGGKDKDKEKEQDKEKDKEGEGASVHERVKLEVDMAAAFDELYLEQQEMKWPHLDFQFEYRTFCEKVRGSPEHYQHHGTSGLRLAFQKQLRESKGKRHAGNQSKQQRNTNDLLKGWAARHGNG